MGPAAAALDFSATRPQRRWRNCVVDHHLSAVGPPGQRRWHGPCHGLAPVTRAGLTLQWNGLREGGLGGEALGGPRIVCRRSRRAQPAIPRRRREPWRGWPMKLPSCSWATHPHPASGARGEAHLNRRRWRSASTLPVGRGTAASCKGSRPWGRGLRIASIHGAEAPPQLQFRQLPAVEVGRGRAPFPLELEFPPLRRSEEESRSMKRHRQGAQGRGGPWCARPAT